MRTIKKFLNAKKERITSLELRIREERKLITSDSTQEDIDKINKIIQLMREEIRELSK